MPPLEMRVHHHKRLDVENPVLGAAVVMVGLGQGSEQDIHSDQPVEIILNHAQQGHSVLAFGVGYTVDAASENARWLNHRAESLLQETLTAWNDRWREIPEDPLLRRGLTYGLAMAVPVDENICLLTDHMLLPLSWNRDAYYVARALLSWGQADTVRRHLLWMFQTAEHADGMWGRCYLANGHIKDAAFQLDQQLFPLLELAEYVLETQTPRPGTDTAADAPLNP